MGSAWASMVERIKARFARRSAEPARPMPTAAAPAPVRDADLARVGDTWEQLAQIDPLWAVLSEPEKKGRRWAVDDFLATGEAEIADLLFDLGRLGSTARGHAVDFGCGAGRLSIALAGRFEQVTAIDISPTMLATAQRLAGGASNIEFVHNTRPDLAFLPDASVDVVYSNIVLQHMDNHLARGYVREFVRLLRPGGFVAFQIPSHLRDDFLPNANNLTRLPAAAFLASIELAGVPTSLGAGETGRVTVTVINASDVEWEQDLTNQINVGNHWRSVDGATHVHDDGRARAPGRVPPGGRFQVELTIRAPMEAGRYVLEVDVVQENVAWFAVHGSAVPETYIEVTVPVGADLPLREVDVAAPFERDYPVFMMQGIPRQDVEALLGEAGADVLDVKEHVTEWFSYRYIARRRPAPSA